MTSIINRRIYLEPRFLDQNIMDHILAKVIEKTRGECTKEYGHILSVERIVNVDNIEDTMFNVYIEVKTLKPEIGSKLSGEVCMVYKDGIFVNIAGKQKMLIPSIILKCYKYDEISRAYVKENVKGKESIKEGDNVNVVVTASRYNKQNFSCVGSLV